MMDAPTAQQMVSLAAVQAMLREQAESFEHKFDLKLKAELDTVRRGLEAELADVKTKYTEIHHQLEMAQRNADAVQRQRLTIENALPGLQSNVTRTNDLKKNIQDLSGKFNETKDDLQYAVETLKSQVANTALETSRLYDQLVPRRGAAALPLIDIRDQHSRMQALIEEQEKHLVRTTARHVSEGSMSCNCAHKTINEKMEKMRHRISNVEQRLTRSLKKFPVAGKFVRAAPGATGDISQDGDKSSQMDVDSNEGGAA